MSSFSIKALVFDMDGTLVNNMRFHQDAWGAWFRAQDLPFDDEAFFHATAGKHNNEILAEYFPRAKPEDYPAMVQSKELIYQNLYAPHRALIPGALTLLQTAKDLGIPCAVGSAAPQMNLDFILGPLGIAPYFQAVVNPNAIIRGKPHPDIFVEAARRMGTAPADCMVFEDAPLGLQAAQAGGMRSIALTTHLPAAALAQENPVHVMADYTNMKLVKTSTDWTLECGK